MTLSAFTRLSSPVELAGKALFPFPKSARLLKSRDFRFRPYRRFQTENFLFVYTGAGSGRLGISIAKKVLRNAVARNRIRRLLREAFRTHLDLMRSCDVNVIGGPSLRQTWRSVKLQDVEAQFARFHQQVK